MLQLNAKRYASQKCKKLCFPRGDFWKIFIYHIYIYIYLYFFPLIYYTVKISITVNLFLKITLSKPKNNQYYNASS